MKIEVDGLKLEVQNESMYRNATGGIRAYRGPLKSVVDIGANAGSVSLYAAKCRGAEFVYAVEPHKADRLQNNVNENGLSTVVHVAPYAIRKRSADGVRLCGRDGGAGVFFHIGTGETLFVRAFAFTDFLENACDLAPDNIIDYLKIDVEGAESEFFEPTSEVAAALEPVRCIDLEWHGLDHPAFEKDLSWVSPCFSANYDADLKLVREFLRDCGFNHYRSNDHDLYAREVK